MKSLLLFFKNLGQPSEFISAWHLVIGALIYIFGGVSIMIWIYNEAVVPKEIEPLIIIWAIMFYGGGPFGIAIVVTYIQAILIRLWKSGPQRLRSLKK